MKQRGLHRGVVLFLLLFAGVDLSLPGFCQEGAEGLSASVAFCQPSGQSFGQSEQPADCAVVSDTGDDSRHDHAPDSAPVEDDCFCCCAHIMPSPYYEAGVFYAKIPVQISSGLNLPSSPLSGLFHPPRHS